MSVKKFVLCLATDGAQDLQARKVYQVLPDKSAVSRGLIRVIDDSGASYLYPQALFAEIELGADVQQALFNESSSPESNAPTISTLRSQLEPLFREHDVSRASIFGSFARGEQTSESDLDILVEFPKGKSLLDLVGLKMAIENKLDRKADVATYNALYPHSRKEILTEAIPIYESQRASVSRRHPRKHPTHRVLSEKTH